MRIEELLVPDSVKEVIIKSGITELYPPQEEAMNAGALGGKTSSWQAPQPQARP